MYTPPALVSNNVKPQQEGVASSTSREVTPPVKMADPHSYVSEKSAAGGSGYDSLLETIIMTPHCPAGQAGESHYGNHSIDFPATADIERAIFDSSDEPDSDGNEEFTNDIHEDKTQDEIQAEFQLQLGLIIKCRLHADSCLQYYVPLHVRIVAF